MVRSAKQKPISFYFAIAAWIVLAIFLIIWDLDVIAFVASVLLTKWFFGLREKWEETTASAYSVFNENGQGIVGGFTAQQFERQLRGGLSEGQNNSSLSAIAVRKHQNSPVEKATVANQERLKRRQAAAMAAERRILLGEK